MPSKEKESKKNSIKKKTRNDKTSHSSKDREKRKSRGKDTELSETRPSSPLQQNKEIPKVIHDPDAVQIFRYYDRLRVGWLTRVDFLQLIRDYSSSKYHKGHRLPLTITNFNSVSMDYEQSEKNSEFEAGQLFERYDIQHLGRLNIDDFQRFYIDFKPQLSNFIQEILFQSAPLLARTEEALPIKKEKVKGGEEMENLPQTNQESRNFTDQSKDESETFCTSLWELCKIWKEDLSIKKKEIDQKLPLVCEALQHERQNNPTQPISKKCDWFSLKDSHADTRKLYEIMIQDMERIQVIGRFIQKYLCLEQGLGSPHNVQNLKNLRLETSKLIHESRIIAMREYRTYHLENELHTRDAYGSHKGEQTDDVVPANQSDSEPVYERGKISSSSTNDKNTERISRASTESVEPKVKNASQTADTPVKQSLLNEIQQRLRIKDEMIYQLLLDRSELQSKNRALEASYEELSKLSASEMSKWAQLTDEMQEELYHLRQAAKSMYSRSPNHLYRTH